MKVELFLSSLPACLPPRAAAECPPRDHTRARAQCSYERVSIWSLDTGLCIWNVGVQQSFCCFPIYHFNVQK